MLTYQNKDAFMPQGQNDAVSAGYAELLLAADPENIELRSELVEMLIERGEFSRALKHLADWQGGDNRPDASTIWCSMAGWQRYAMTSRRFWLLVSALPNST
ncbi:hypothetical protein ULG90_22725 [Halopseudomonas pachastrellae]|nr:hypothetical protein ULG90_22725 [Halopseudomonas pachastrellae]